MRLEVITVSMFVWLSGCAPVAAPLHVIPAGEMRLHRVELSLKDKKYPNALAELKLIRSEYPGSPEAAYAHFETALIHAMPDNPELNFGEAIIEFESFRKLFPDDKRSRDAEAWISALTANMELKKENDKLNKNIEQLKRLDIRHEERRKGK